MTFRIEFYRYAYMCSEHTYKIRNDLSPAKVPLVIRFSSLLYADLKR